MHNMKVPFPMGPPSLAQILRGCCSGCVGMFNFVVVSWSMKFPGALESISTEKTAKWSECCICTFSMKD